MPDERIERKLTAIVAADVAAYSRLMHADEEGTLARLKQHRKELVDIKISEHRGRIIKTTGDGLLIAFPSVVDAVRCADEVQNAMHERNIDVPIEKRIEFRIGINIGDVIVEGDDIYGDGVNVAARLEALATPGSIWLSQGVRDQVIDKLPLPFADMGEHHLEEHSPPGAGLSDLGRRHKSPALVGLGDAGQAIDRTIAFCQHERRSRAGVLCRRRD